jgi:hypothetical protein
MTVPVQVTVSSAIANGSTTVFPFSFKVTDADDLLITLDGVEQTSGFTVAVGASSGTVTFSVAPASGVVVVISLDPVLQRETDYQQFGSFPAAIVNEDMDRLWLAMQKFAQDYVRALKLPVDTLTDQLINYTPGERASSLISFDANGNLDITALSALAISVSSGSFTTDTFDGTGAQTAFTLSRAPGIKGNTYVFVGGAYLRKDQYEISNTTLTFDVAPASGTANVEVCQSVALEAGSPADGTVTVASLAAGALAATAAGRAKIADGYFAADATSRAKFADKFVTLAKIVDMADGKLLGNVSGGSAAPAEISEASQAEAEAGALQTRWMNPLRTAQAIAALSMTVGTAQTATGSETEFDFTGVPATAKRITLVFDEVSLSGTDDILVQLIDASPETTGYVSTSAAMAAAGTGVSQSTSGFVIRMGVSAAAVFSGTVTLIQISANRWIAEHNGKAATTYTVTGGGSKTLSDTLTGVRVTATGSNTFDNGSINAAVG